MNNKLTILTLAVIGFFVGLTIYGWVLAHWVTYRDAALKVEEQHDQSDIVPISVTKE